MTLQVGNFQVTVYSLAMIAFVLIATGRELTGAAILAYATVGKIVPGVLVLFLLTARRWRAVIYTAAFSLLLCAITVAVFGWKPIGDFIWYEMPKLASGEAFPQTERISDAAGEPVGLRGDRAAAQTARGVVRPQLVWPGGRPPDRLALRPHRRCS